MRFLWVLIVGSISLGSFADYNSINDGSFNQEIVEENFCSQEDTQAQLYNLNNRLNFTNRGGLLNKGVCWWHSRFTRNANVLVYFSPSKPKPVSMRELKKILKKIQKGREVVEIPGFTNLADFSKEYEEEIQSLLNKWQLSDGLIRQRWIGGLSGRSKVRPEKLKSIMDDTFYKVQNGEVVYQKLQEKGITAHAWLVIGMKPTNDGYKLHVVDSNYKRVREVTYRYGQTHFNRGKSKVLETVEYPFSNEDKKELERFSTGNQLLDDVNRVTKYENELFDIYQEEIKKGTKRVSCFVVKDTRDIKCNIRKTWSVPFVPYTEYEKEWDKIQNVKLTHCLSRDNKDENKSWEYNTAQDSSNRESHKLYSTEISDNSSGVFPGARRQ